MKFRLVEEKDKLNMDKNIFTIYVVKDINDFNLKYELDESTEKNSVEYLMSLPNNMIRKLPDKIINNIEDERLIDKIYKVIPNRITDKQRELLKSYYQSIYFPLDSNTINNFLNKIKNCKRIILDTSLKNDTFMQKYDLDNNDYLQIIKQIDNKDFTKSMYSYQDDRLGHQLIEFICPNIKIDKFKDAKKLVVYIKLDRNDTTENIVAGVSIHEAK